MPKKYEYHKQNDYPGERIAERKRVAARKEEADKTYDEKIAEKGRTEKRRANARVARKGRKDEKLMDSEVKRSSDRAARVNRKRNTADTIGLVVIAGLIVILLAGAVWGSMAMQKQSDEIDAQSEEIDYLNSQLDKAKSDIQQLSIANSEITGDTKPPEILYLSPLTSVYPSNNQMDVPVRVPITVMFSEDMDPSTINEETFKVEQRGTPEDGEARSLQLKGLVTYSDRKATFTSDERFYPNQIYGNVFTVTVTDEVKDIAGNSLQNDYIWSFTTGSNPFNTDGTTSQTG
ncbi:MAG: Ig-like domain-containing protein [Candidatus Woesearchaeota archaeon]